MNFPFQITDWNLLPREQHQGEASEAWWQTLQHPGLRIRVVEYAPGYLADHWCTKGHLVYCLEGEFVTELADGQKMHLRKGMSYLVSDEMSSHRSSTDTGTRLLVVDGDFLSFIPH